MADTTNQGPISPWLDKGLGMLFGTKPAQRRGMPEVPTKPIAQATPPAVPLTPPPQKPLPQPVLDQNNPNSILKTVERMEQGL